MSTLVHRNQPVRDLVGRSWFVNMLVRVRASSLLVILPWLMMCYIGSQLLAAENQPDAATVIYRVAAGDTLSRVCWRYKVRADIIRRANPGLGAGDTLAVGQQLVIPRAPLPPAVLQVIPVAVATTPAKPVTVALAMAGPVPVPLAPLVATHEESRPALPAPTPPKREKIASVPPAPAVLDRESVEDNQPPTPQAAKRDFLDAARRLAARRLRYDERWTPPGQHEAWAMDCSNTARYLYRTVAGIDIGRTASDQYYFLRQKKCAWDVPTGHDHLPKLDYLKARLQPGDLLFWENTYRPVRTPDITHVMIFLGEDAEGHWQMAGSQARDGVSIYRFDPQATKGGYSSWFGLIHHEGRFVAYGRPLASEE